ncbi:hypothetical protein EJ05DRAFT_72993 [Pseudovirgaria hyperparasitica]|uniref:Uncharacterized protein n=1 Tax=Pseudovirgaria hyperparasitica TaxID=470096 RepID=A0A6A6W3U1_9PEZI|nr:uncharacterized protein EJ05DRAFT_72993 [Pseudovirgaria hyperparasitica]KAF2756694.1 hypothetical protein EJ05DRAFT_72993 [Pseudovirgaria hyperparasitica]
MSSHHGGGYELHESHHMSEFEPQDEYDPHDAPQLDQQHKTLLATTRPASSASTQHQRAFRQRKAEWSPRHTFLRAVGLKIAASWAYKREDPKTVVSGSRWIAFQRLGVHLLPAVFTLLVLLMNVIGVYNGPVISTGGNFALQVASKFHELAITVLRSLSATS